MTFVCSSCGFQKDGNIYPFTLSSIYYTFFSGKPSNVSSDLAPPVQLYSYLFLHIFVTIQLRSGPCINNV